MQFLNPFFLSALIAAAIPIVLHFLSRRRVIDIPFAPMRFLRPTQERQMRRMNLRRLLLLLIRVAIVTFVVLALARPTLTGGLASLIRSGEGASAVILVDDSASMQAQQSGGTVFDLAREEVNEIASQLGSDDEVSVALFSDVARPLFAEFLRDPGLVMAELGRVAPGARSTDYVSALDQAYDLLQRADRGHREIYVVGDFQRTEVDSTRLARLQARFAGEPATNIYLRPLRVEPFVNRQVAEVERSAALLRAGETAELAVRVRQDGDEPLPVQAFLEVGDAMVGETELSLPAGGQQRHVFPVTLPEAGDLVGSTRLRPDRYPLDDEYFFALTVSEQVPVLVLRGVSGEEGERDPLLFLLATLDPEGQGRGRFAVQVENASNFDVKDLPSSPVVVGSDLRDLGAARLAALSDYLEDGGTLLLYVGDPRVQEYTNEKLLPAWTSLRLSPFRGEQAVFERLEVAARDHPVFDGFDDESIATLEEVRVRNFYRIGEEAGRVLLRFAGGGAAVTEFEVGKGRVILCGFDTSAVAGDLPWSPMFLPLSQRLTGYLATAGWGRFGRHFAVGEDIVVQAPEGAAASATYAVVLPDGERRDATLDASVLPARVQFESPEQPGAYRFEADGVPFVQCVVNTSREESDRRFWTSEEFGDRFRPEEGNASFRGLDGDSAAEAVREARQGHGIHRWFLILAGLLLVLESFLSRRVGLGAAKEA